MSALPELPAPRFRFEVEINRVGERLDYTASEMQAYALASIQALQAELQQQALVHLSSEGQWIEHTGKLAAELAEVRRDAEQRKAALLDIQEVCAYSPHRELNVWDDGLAKVIHRHTEFMTERAAIDRARSTGAGEGEEAWKLGNEFAPFHPSASHVAPDYRDGWNACYYAAAKTKAGTFAVFEAAVIAHGALFAAGKEPRPDRPALEQIWLAVDRVLGPALPSDGKGE